MRILKSILLLSLIACGDSNTSDPNADIPGYVGSGKLSSIKTHTVAGTNEDFESLKAYFEAREDLNSFTGYKGYKAENNYEDCEFDRSRSISEDLSSKTKTVSLKGDGCPVLTTINNSLKISKDKPLEEELTKIQSIKTEQNGFGSIIVQKLDLVSNSPFMAIKIKSKFNGDMISKKTDDDSEDSMYGNILGIYNEDIMFQDRSRGLFDIGLYGDKNEDDTTITIKISLERDGKKALTFLYSKKVSTAADESGDKKEVTDYERAQINGLKIAVEEAKEILEFLEEYLDDVMF